MIEERQLQILRALVKREIELRAEGRPTDFLFMQVTGPAFGFKPGIDNEEELEAMEADLQQLAEEGFVRLSPGQQPSVLWRLTLTNDGRVAGREQVQTAELGKPAPMEAPPNVDAVLSWVHGLSLSPQGASALSSGGALLNKAIVAFDTSQLEALVECVFDLGDAGLLLFEDPAAMVEGIDPTDRLGMVSKIRISPSGLDRVSQLSAPRVQNIHQVINATNAQVAAGDINNINSYDDLLRRLGQALDELEGVDEEARQEAQGLLEKLGSASSDIGVGVATSGGGALLGTLLKKILGLE